MSHNSRVAREDYYALLGVAIGADPLAIKRAYRRLARRYHPDINPGDREAEHLFQAVSRAYAVLSDPAKRGAYDRGASPDPGTGVGFSAFSEFAAAGGARRVEELIAELLGRPEGRGDGESVRHLTTEVTLELAEAVRGVATSVSVQRELSCSDCAGRGTVAGGRCERCGGRGKVVELERLRIRIPPGVEDGSRLRVTGKGHGSTGRRSDLLLRILVKPHPYFRRRGGDVFAHVPVTLAEALLGADIEVPTVDGRVRVELPAGTVSGQRFRLRGRGIRLADGRRGHHYYTIDVVMPQEVDESAAAALRRIRQQDPRRHLPPGL
ncbi:MAG TPA: DnaJ C-terminal domain-containing protein [Thermoanaerobaculia bacterium]|nr:DnaJ C-terminal domain-containing protein [Thermoanaerobaculia bacterium]